MGSVLLPPSPRRPAAESHLVLLVEVLVVLELRVEREEHVQRLHRVLLLLFLLLLSLFLLLILSLSSLLLLSWLFLDENDQGRDVRFLGMHFVAIAAQTLRNG